MKAIIYTPIKNKTLISIADSFKLEKIDELPYHLTFYSLELLDNKKRELEEIVEKIRTSIIPLKIRINRVETTGYRIARFSIKKSTSLQKLHERILRECRIFKNKNIESKVREFYHEFSREEQELIDLYGRPNVMQRFSPHITIGKIGNNPIRRNLDIAFNIDDIAVYYIT